MDDGDWARHYEAVQQRMTELREQDIDSRTLCGYLDRGWIRWPADRRAQHRQLLADLWDEQAPQVPREGKAFFMGGNDSGAKTALLADPHSDIDPDHYLVIDAFRIAENMAVRGMIPHIDGLSPMEASALVQEEAWQLAEWLGQKAYPQKCNVLWVLFGEDRGGDHNSATPPETKGTIRSLIDRYQQQGNEFPMLRDALVARWRDRPAKTVTPADWGEVYRRAEQVPDPDDLIWISVAEDTGTLTRQQIGDIFTAIERAADQRRDPENPVTRDGEQPGEVLDGNETATRWQYFADEHGAIRTPTADGPEHHGQRYWGHTAGWIAASTGCTDWAESALTSPHYRPVDQADITATLNRIDHQPGGVFRDPWRYWNDASWSADEARQRAAALESDLIDPSNYDTWGTYRADRDELQRLREFLDSTTS